MTRARVAAGAHERGQPARVRRVPVDRAVALPRRDPRRARSSGSTPAYTSAYQSAFAHGALRVPHEPVRPRRGRARGPGKPRQPTSTRTRISPPRQLRAGMRVRHAQFGVGTVISRRGAQRRLKITVRFNRVGVEEAAGEIREARAGVVDARMPSVRQTGDFVSFDHSTRGSASFPSSSRSRPASRRRRPSSPSSISISRTPWVARPMARMSPAFMRRIMPCWLMSISSSSSCT